MKFITSINPNARIDRQTYCINSWKKYGLPIVSVQSIEENLPPISGVEYQQVQRTPNIFNSHFPSISDLIQPPCILINSDIELTWSQEDFIKYMSLPVPVAGIRRENGKLNPFGIDLFILHTSLPENPFLMGKPGWDYWMLLEIHTLGPFLTVTDGLIHEEHDERWNRAELIIAQDTLAKMYNTTSRNVTLNIKKLTGRR